MELIPVLEPEEKPRDRQWYVVSASGAAPGVSVGHTCVFLPSADGGKGRIAVVGGADPDGSFSESYMMNLETHEWELPEWSGLQARYEHCSFVPETEPRSVWVFAGAQKSGNRNCVQVLRASEGVWETVSAKGDPPSVRTYHTNSACVGDRLYVFSGGDAGADPVADTHVHVFDSVTATWTQPESDGTPPTPRHGHAITAVGSGVYIHGGMSGETLHDDMFLLDTETMKWEKVKAEGEIPPGVAAHSSVSCGKNIFIFGGMTSEGATNSMYKFQCDERRWTLLQFGGDLPPGRLDHSMCSVPWRATTAARETRDEDEQRLCFIFGGMDTQGVLFNDCLVTLLT
ncbi:hypothetical protein R3I94_002546 [Phoxinus phoxinus]